MQRLTAQTAQHTWSILGLQLLGDSINVVLSSIKWLIMSILNQADGKV